MPKKERNLDSAFNQISDLLNGSMKKDIDHLWREADRLRKEAADSVKEAEEEVKKVKGQIKDSFSKTAKPHERMNYYEGTYDSYNKNIDKELRDMLARNQNQMGKPTSKNTKKPLRKVDETVAIHKFEDFNEYTHDVHLSTIVTGQIRENGQSKIIGMEEVEWWEYVLIYGFFKATKIAVEYNAVKSMIKDSKYVSRIVNKGNLIVTFKPKKSGDTTKTIEKLPTGESIEKITGKVYREGKIVVEIPYIAEQKVEEYKKGNFLYEDKYESFVPDYAGLGNQLKLELEQRKVKDVFKFKIINEIQNGRISRV